jgi:hypothetical protein
VRNDVRFVGGIERAIAEGLQDLRAKFFAPCADSARRIYLSHKYVVTRRPEELSDSRKILHAGNASETKEAVG